VALTWTREERPLHQNCLVLRWSERDGPPVTVPEKSGFGLGLVRNEAKYSLRGKATIRFDPAGLLVELEIPLSG
jgi:two-component sensor histidine kinase